jgi:hypothetical protein
MSKYLLAMIVISLTTGCTTYYKHSSKPNYLFESDKAECRKAHTSQRCTTTNPTSNTECKKDSIHDKVNCTTVHNPAVTTCRDDVNRTGANNCLAQKGWYKTDKEGNRK